MPFQIVGQVRRPQGRHAGGHRQVSGNGASDADPRRLERKWGIVLSSLRRSQKSSAARGRPKREARPTACPAGFPSVGANSNAAPRRPSRRERRAIRSIAGVEPPQARPASSLEKPSGPHVNADSNQRRRIRSRRRAKHVWSVRDPKPSDRNGEARGRTSARRRRTRQASLNGARRPNATSARPPSPTIPQRSESRQADQHHGPSRRFRNRGRAARSEHPKRV